MTLRYKKLAGIGLALASALTLAGCYDDGYGYGGVSVGYGSGGYYGYPGYYDYYPGYYGWYDGFYYPGSGYYIYDRGGHRRQWDDNHRRYWEGRREAWRNHQGGTGGGQWQGLPHDGNWQGRADQQRGWVGDGRNWNGGQGRGWRGGQGAQAAPATPRSDSGMRGWRGRGMRDRDQ